MRNENYGAVILAAGKGTRMHSSLPKVLHELLGEPMLRMVLSAIAPVFGKNIWAVVGHQAEMVQNRMAGSSLHFTLQKEQLGTGHALAQVWPELDKAGLAYVLVVNGDVPLVTTDEINAFIDYSLEKAADISFMSITLEAPAAFGRVMRNKGDVSAIVEAKDYDRAKHGPEPKEVNAGVYLLRVDAMAPLLKNMTNSNKSGEYYITELISLAVAKKLRVSGVNMGDAPGLMGVNSPLELTQAEEELRARIVEDWQRKGVIIRNPSAVRISAGASLAPGAEICGPCEIYGTSSIGAYTKIESHCWIKDTVIANDCMVRSFCHFDKARMGAHCLAGPYARLRPGAVLEEAAHVGNFVEIKKARLGRGAKANHLSYLGDADIGAGSNIGAGAITCNYDGVNKHKTVIGEAAFIGSNSALVAPVTIGAGALVGAGSVITRDVADGELAIARARQSNITRRK